MYRDEHIMYTFHDIVHDTKGYYLYGNHVFIHLMNVILYLLRFCIRYGPKQYLGHLLLSFFTSTILALARR